MNCTMLVLKFFLLNSTDTSQNEMKTSTPINAQLTPQTNPIPQSLESMLQQTDLKGNGL